MAGARPSTPRPTGMSEVRDAALDEAEDACDEAIMRLEGDCAEQSGAYTCRDAIRALRSQPAQKGHSNV